MPGSQVSNIRPTYSIQALPELTPHTRKKSATISSSIAPRRRKSSVSAHVRIQPVDAPSAPSRAQSAPPEQPHHSRTPAASPSSTSATRTPTCPRTRTPPELNDTTRGCQSPAIPLDWTGEMQPPVLTPATLFEEQRRRDTLKLETYNRILSAVHAKIRASSTLPTATQMITFDVPEWQPGCPSFDVKDCILYVVFQLRSSGFKVIYASPNRLLISWKEHSIQYYQNESPIRQAMVAAAASSKPTGGAGTSTSTTTAVAPKKKASDYRAPPISSGGGDKVLGLSEPSSSVRRGTATTITFI